MIHTYVQLDEIEFEDRFGPLRDAQGAWIDFDWTDPADRRAIEVATRERRIWTTLDVDGFVVLSAGWHFVNRLGYVISERSFEEDVEIEVFDSEDLRDWNERLLGTTELESDLS